MNANIIQRNRVTYISFSLVILVSVLINSNVLKAQDLSIVKLPEISKKLKKNAELMKMLKNYCDMALSPEKINTEKKLIQVFEIRDKLILELTQTTENYFVEAMENGDTKGYDSFEAELNKIGIQVSYAEGQITGLTTAIIFEDIIEKIASKPYKLFIDFKNELANTYGGEYPYLDLTAYTKMIEVGEQMRNEFPENEYTKAIEKNFMEAVETITDVHKVISDNNQNGEYILFDTSTSFFPSATNAENFTNYIKNYPNSQFTPIVKKILENISEIKINSKESYERLYVVVIEEAKKYDEAKQIVHKYLLSGVDIPHVVTVKEGGIQKYFITYRFYGTMDKAKKALIIIKKSKPLAKILSVNSANEVIK